MIKYEGNLYWTGDNSLIQSKEKLTEWLEQFPANSWFSFVVMPLGSINDTAQRRLYYKWCDIMASEFGWDSGMEMHAFLKKTYNNDESTKSFSTEDWSTYMLKVSAFASKNNITLPTGYE